MLSVLLVSLLGAEPVKLASTSFTCEGVTPALCEGYLDRFVTALAAGGRVKVTTQRDIGEVLGVERQKQLLGCGDDASSCMMELASALGVEGVLVGSIAVTPQGFLLNLKVVRASDATRWLATSRRVKDETELQQALDAHAAEFRMSLSGSNPFRVVPWVFFGAGAACSVLGAVLYGLSKVDAGTLKSTSVQSPMEVSATATRGATLQPLGIGFLSIGIPFLLGGLLWLVWNAAQ